MAANEWDDDALRRLRKEYKLSNTTQKQLRQKYGLPRHKIWALLRQANDKFGVIQPDLLINGLNWKVNASQSAVKEREQ